jgi:hypothetical protein
VDKDQVLVTNPRIVIAEQDDETLAQLREHFAERRSEREIRIKLLAVEHVMRERGLID